MNNNELQNSSQDEPLKTPWDNLANVPFGGSLQLDWPTDFATSAQAEKNKETENTKEIPVTDNHVNELYKKAREAIGGNTFFEYVVSNMDYYRNQTIAQNMDLIYEHAAQKDPIFQKMAESTGAYGEIFQTAPAEGYGNYGFYVLKTFITDATPANIDMLKREEQGFSDPSGVAETRSLAFGISEYQGSLFTQHDIIHEQCGGAYELLQSLIDYYDANKDTESQNPDSIQAAKEQVERVLKQYPKLRAYISDEDTWTNIQNYDMKYTSKINTGATGIKDYANEDTRQIDTLRRLVEIHKSKRTEVPVTSDETLNSMLQWIDSQRLQNGELSLELRQHSEVETENGFEKPLDLHDVLAYVNTDLQKREQLKRGQLTPGHIEAYDMIEQACISAIKNMSQKDWEEGFWDETLKEIVRFNELTASGGTQSDFDQFWRSFSDIPADASEDVKNAQYQKLARRVNQNIESLNAFYTQQGAEEYQRHADVLMHRPQPTIPCGAIEQSILQGAERRVVAEQIIEKLKSNPQYLVENADSILADKQNPDQRALESLLEAFAQKANLADYNPGELAKSAAFAESLPSLAREDFLQLHGRNRLAFHLENLVSSPRQKDSQIQTEIAFRDN